MLHYARDAWELVDTWLQPMEDHPQVGLVVAASAIRQSLGGDVPEAAKLTTDWYFERGEASRYFGPDNQITLDLMTDKGVNEARQEPSMDTCTGVTGSRR